MILTGTIQVHPIEDQKAIVFLNKSLTKELGIENYKRIHICFGGRKYTVELKQSDEITKNIINLSSKVITFLHLPLDLKYELSVKNNELIIGPYIGILFTSANKSKTKKRLKKSLVYTTAYDHLNGALVIFTLKDIDKETQLIKGYFYYPETQEWKKATLPYPSSIYCKFPLNAFWRNHFLSNIGNTFFNGHLINKWTMHRWLSSMPDISKSLPNTVLYQEREDIFNFLETYPSILIKPKKGFFGRKIIKISKTNNKYTIHYRENSKWKVSKECSKEQIIEIINNLVIPKKFIIQEFINFVKYNSRSIDFRCIVQKNEKLEWEYVGTIGRISAKGQSISNIHNHGKAIPYYELMTGKLNYSEEKTKDLEQKMKEFCLRVANALDSMGVHCGNLGFDLGIDKNEYIWLIEINNRNPNPSRTLFKNSENLYLKNKTTPLFYAKVLAGFNVTNKKK